jgi:hypothetical protein
LLTEEEYLRERYGNCSLHPSKRVTYLPPSLNQSCLNPRSLFKCWGGTSVAHRIEPPWRRCLAILSATKTVQVLGWMPPLHTGLSHLGEGVSNLSATRVGIDPCHCVEPPRRMRLTLAHKSKMGVVWERCPVAATWHCTYRGSPLAQCMWG